MRLHPVNFSSGICDLRILPSRSRILPCPRGRVERLCGAQAALWPPSNNSENLSHSPRSRRSPTRYLAPSVSARLDLRMAPTFIAHNNMCDWYQLVVVKKEYVYDAFINTTNLRHCLRRHHDDVGDFGRCAGYTSPTLAQSPYLHIPPQIRLTGSLHPLEEQGTPVQVVKIFVQDKEWNFWLTQVDTLTGTNYGWLTLADLFPRELRLSGPDELWVPLEETRHRQQAGHDRRPSV